MAQIKVSDLTFCYDGSYDNIFEHVSFSVDTSWNLGFVGRNGRGKTTFFKLLTGAYEYTGSISAPVVFEYFPSPVSDPSDMAYDVLNNLVPDVPEWRIVRELSLLGIDTDDLWRPYSTYSGGEQTKLRLAAMFLLENGFPLIDEPTNHLDMDARRLVSQYLSSKHGFMLISHDRRFLDGCVDHILSINKTTIECVKGNYSSWQENKRRQNEYELAENERISAEVSKLGDAVRRATGWSDSVEAEKIGSGKADKVSNRGAIGAKSAKMMKRAKSIETRRLRAVEEKSSLLKDIERDETLKLFPLTYPKQRLFELIDLSVAFGDKQVLTDLSLSMSPGERVALTGRNGCGKTTLIKLILGEGIPYTGKRLIGSGLSVSYISQDTSWLKGDVSDFPQSEGIDPTRFFTILRKLDFPRVQFEKQLESLSEGQKKKVLISMSLCRSAHLYIWDEPLNYIDVISRGQIEALIAEYAPTMLFVEHDVAFIENIATRVIHL